MTSVTPLNELREKIDEIDQQILNLINQRASCAMDVAKTKIALGEQGTFYRPDRESLVLRRIKELNPGPLPDQTAVRFFRELMSSCLALEKPLDVAYLGPEGTFTQQAVLKHFGNAVKAVPEATINDLFMTTVGGALRRYLDAKGELPEATLTCMVPMSFRGPDKTADLGNQIGMAVMPLHTELHDPIDRLQEIRRGAAKAKALNALVGRDLAARLFEVLPDAASEFATRRLVIEKVQRVLTP